jgi:branched-chain amino acid transport system substrate-binding protein
MGMLRRSVVFFVVLLVALAAGCSKEVKIGAVISESGAVASYGEKVKKGLDLALDEINAAGGFRGGNLQVVYKDDATNSSIGRRVTEELIQDEDVRVIIGAISSPVTLSIAEICEEQQVVLLSPTSSAPSISDAGDYIFRNWPSDFDEGNSMARFAKDLGLERVVVFALHNAYGEGLRDIFTQQYSGKYRKVVKAFSFDESESTDFEAMIAEVKELEPDGIYIATYVTSQAEILRRLDEAGVEAVRMGSSAVVPQELVGLAGETAEDLVFSQTIFDVNSTEPIVAGFVRAYRDKYNEDPDIYSAHGYDALFLLRKAMENGGSAHPRDIQLGLISIQDYMGAAGRTAFNDQGDVIRYPRMFIIKQGVAIPYDKFVEEGGSLFKQN